MKTVKFILPVVAIMVAVAGVFATEKSSGPTFNPIDVTAISVAPCTKDGICDLDIATSNCRLKGTLTPLYVKASGACANAATTGKFIADF
jgi:hypothetical protein